MSKSKELFAYEVEGFPFLVYGDLPESDVITHSQLRYSVDDFRYGIPFTADFKKYAYIAKHRDYQKPIYVSVVCNQLLCSKIIQSGYLILRPDTAGSVRDALYERLRTYDSFTAVTGYTHVASPEGILTVLCDYWNSNY